METEVENLFACGDGAGVTRGLVQASASGLVAARAISRRLAGLCRMIDFREFRGQGNIYFLRHGESEGNVAGIAQGLADFPLSARGRVQAAAAGPWFQGRRLDLILHVTAAPRQPDGRRRRR